MAHVVSALLVLLGLAYFLVACTPVADQSNPLGPAATTPSPEPTRLPPTSTAEPLVYPSATSLPSPTAAPAPQIYNIRFCNRPCEEPGAQPATSFPEGTIDVYLSWEYENFYLGMPYTRLWSNRGEEWIRMDCEWQGPESGTFPLKLWDTGGLRSGTWVMQMLISGDLAAEAQIELEGNNEFWEPAGNPPCPDFQE